MGLASTLARRSLLQRPGRTFFSILGVAVGIATVVFVYTLDYNTLRSRTSAPVGVEEKWQADLEVRPKKGLKDASQTLHETPGVLDATAFFETEANFVAGGPKGGPANRVRVGLFALEAESARGLEPYYLEAGRDIDPAAAGREVLIGKPLAEKFELELGARVFLAQPARMAKRVCKEGEYQSVGAAEAPRLGEAFDVVGILRDEKLGRQHRGEVVIVDYAVGNQLYSDAFVEPSFWVRKDPGVPVEKLEAGLGKQFTYGLDRKVTVGQTAEEVAFRNGVLAAGLLALALGLYVVFHTLSVSLVERVREVGVLHSLGTRRRQIARIFFFEALFIVSSAGALGLGIGLWITKRLLSIGITTIGAGNHINDFWVPWSVVLPLTGLGMAIALLGSVYPLIKARHTDVIAAIRGEDTRHDTGVTRGFHLFAALLLVGVLPAMYFFIVPVVGARQGPLVGAIMAGVGIMAVFLALPLVVPAVVGMGCSRLIAPFQRAWPLAGKLAARTVERSPTRVAASVSAIALVTACFVSLRGMTNSLQAEVQVWADEAVANKVWVRELPDVPFERVRASLQEVSGVLGVESRDASIPNAPFLVLGLRPNELASYGPCARDPRLVEQLASKKGMIVSKRLAAKFDYQVGDEVVIGTPGSGVQVFPVIAVSDEYGYFLHPDKRLYGVVSDEYMRRFFCLDTTTVQSVSVRLDGHQDPGMVEAAMTAAMPEMAGKLIFETAEQVLAEHLWDIKKDFALFDFILGLTALLACLGVLNGQLLSALERSKELGVLRALGMSRGQLAGTVLIESLVVGATGGLLGLALGSALTPVIVYILEVVSGLALPYRSAGAFLGLCMVGALAVTGAAALYPIWRMNRMDAVSAVRAG